MRSIDFRETVAKSHFGVVYAVDVHDMEKYVAAGNCMRTRPAIVTKIDDMSEARYILADEAFDLVIPNMSPVCVSGNMIVDKAT